MTMIIHNHYKMTAINLICIKNIKAGQLAPYNNNNNNNNNNNKNNNNKIKNIQISIKNLSNLITPSNHVNRKSHA